MTEPQIVVLLYIGVILARIPRIKERWTAPLLRGPEWFFDVAVAPDFLGGPGAAILRDYRWRLFIPWLIELPILAVLCLTSRGTLFNVSLLITGITLFTRFNYYAARIAAEKRSRSFEQADASQPVSNVVLSLEPRTLASYTNWWMEGGIALALGTAAVWLVYVSNTSQDQGMLRRVVSLLVITVYIQAGMLLIKQGVIRSGGAAPVDNVEQYLAWRESLRRLTTGICDTCRFLFSLNPVIVLSFAAGGPVRLVAALGFSAAGLIALGYEWRSRMAHLEVARRTKPAKFPLLPGARTTRGVVCFWPSLPVLLLKTANGYALNLASVSVGIAGLYFAGFAGLWLWLARM